MLTVCKILKIVDSLIVENQADTTVNVNYTPACAGKYFKYKIAVWEQDGTFSDDFIVSSRGEGQDSFSGSISGSDTWDGPLNNYFEFYAVVVSDCRTASGSGDWTSHTRQLFHRCPVGKEPCNYTFAIDLNQLW